MEILVYADSHFNTLLLVVYLSTVEKRFVQLERTNYVVVFCTVTSDGGLIMFTRSGECLETLGSKDNIEYNLYGFITDKDFGEPPPEFAVESETDASFSPTPMETTGINRVSFGQPPPGFSTNVADAQMPTGDITGTFYGQSSPASLPSVEPIPTTDTSSLSPDQHLPAFVTTQEQIETNDAMITREEPSHPPLPVFVTSPTNDSPMALPMQTNETTIFSTEQQSLQGPSIPPFEASISSPQPAEGKSITKFPFTNNTFVKDRIKSCSLTKGILPITLINLSEFTTILFLIFNKSQ